MISSWKKLFSLEDHRANELKNKAALLKMQFHDKDEFGLKDLLSQFEIFEHRNGEISNILSTPGKWILKTISSIINTSFQMENQLVELNNLRCFIIARTFLYHYLC
jgi:hypothetical protein